MFLTPGPSMASLGSSSDSFEAMLQDVEQEKAYDELLNLLDTTLKQPVNLLTADRQEIAGLPWVSPWLADRIVGLRQKGELGTLEDLKRIEGVNDRLVELLRPFAVVRPLEKHALPLRTSLRLRAVASPPSSSFKKLKTYGMYEVEARGIRGGFAVEKDKDEARLNDFQTFYVEKEWAWVKVTAGKFILASGHGLVFSNSYGQSPSTIDPWRTGRGAFGIRPSIGSEENFLLEGVGLSLKGKAFDLCVAASRSSFDASLDDAGRVKSLSTSGSHVTRSEIEGKDQLKEQLFGAACRYRRGGLQVGLSLSHARLNRDFLPGRFDWPKDQARLAGGANISVQQGQAMVFAEGALDEGGRGALIGGLAFDRSGTEFLLMGRRYSEKYLSLHSRPFAFYSGLGTGERGLFALVTFKPLRKGQISIGSDLHRKTGGEDGSFSTSGSETFVDLNLDVGSFAFALGEKLSRNEEPPSATGNGGGSVGGGTEETARLRSRVDVTYRPAPKMDLRVRYETLAAKKTESGSLTGSTSDVLRFDLSLDRWRPATINTGFYTFSVEAYASRVYQYEAGIPYYPSLEMLKSDGSRWYAALSFEVKPLGKIAAKFGRTLYKDGEDKSELLATYMMRI
jgi:hypothetical protein